VSGALLSVSSSLWLSGLSRVSVRGSVGAPPRPSAPCLRTWQCAPSLSLFPSLRLCFLCFSALCKAPLCVLCSAADPTPTADGASLRPTAKFTRQQQTNTRNEEKEGKAIDRKSGVCMRSKIGSLALFFVAIRPVRRLQLIRCRTSTVSEDV
jgi:hypothetical protein